MGRPRWEVAGNEMGRRICHRRWDVQDGKWQVMRWEDKFTTGDRTSKMGNGKTNLPQEMGRPRWQVADNEMVRQIYHRRWDVQDGKRQVMRWEDIFTTGDGTSRMGSAWQLMRWEDEFATGDGTSKMGSGR